MLGDSFHTYVLLISSVNFRIVYYDALSCTCHLEIACVTSFERVRFLAHVYVVGVSVRVCAFDLMKFTVRNKHRCSNPLSKCMC